MAETKIRSGKWKGPGGSVLDIQVSGKVITGTYQTPVGNVKFEQKFEVTGFTDGEVIGIVVLWEGAESLTSWTGRWGSDTQGEYITALWHLVRKYRDKEHTIPTEEWDSFLTHDAKWYLHTNA